MFQTAIPTVVYQISAVFHYFGMWQREDEPNLREMGKKLLHLMFSLSFLVSFVTGAFLSDNMSEQTFLAAAATVFFVGFVRLFFVLRKKKEISAFLLDIGVHSFIDEEEFLKIETTLAKFTFVANSLRFIMICGFFFPLLSCLSIFSSEKRLPINIAFPLNWKSSKIAYCMAVLFIECGLFFCATTTLVVLQIWFLMLNYSIQYQVLGNHFKRLGLTKSQTIQSVQNEKISLGKNQSLFLQDLIELIERHRHIQKTVTNFKDCFAYLFMIQITTTSITICGLIFFLSFNSKENVFEVAFISVTLIYNLLDLLTLMYLANEIKLSSNDLSYCLFQSNWMDQSKSSKKCLLILTELLRHPQELVIFKLYALNLERFTAILHLAYSMFNILQNFK